MSMSPPVPAEMTMDVGVLAVAFKATQGTKLSSGSSRQLLAYVVAGVVVGLAVDEVL